MPNITWTPRERDVIIQMAVFLYTRGRRNGHSLTHHETWRVAMYVLPISRRRRFSSPVNLGKMYEVYMRLLTDNVGFTKVIEGHVPLEFSDALLMAEQVTVEMVTKFGATLDTAVLTKPAPVVEVPPIKPYESRDQKVSRLEAEIEVLRQRVDAQDEIIDILTGIAPVEEGDDPEPAENRPALKIFDGGGESHHGRGNPNPKEFNLITVKKDIPLTLVVADNPAPKPKAVIPEIITVTELSRVLNLRPSDVVKELMRCGVMATVNQALGQGTAMFVATELGFNAEAAPVIQEKKMPEPEPEAPAEEVDPNNDDHLKGMGFIFFIGTPSRLRGMIDRMLNGLHRDKPIKAVHLDDCHTMPYGDVPLIISTAHVIPPHKLNYLRREVLNPYEVDGGWTQISEALHDILDKQFQYNPENYRHYK